MNDGEKSYRVVNTGGPVLETDDDPRPPNVTFESEAMKINGREIVGFKFMSCRMGGWKVSGIYERGGRRFGTHVCQCGSRETAKLIVEAMEKSLHS